MIRSDKKLMGRRLKINISLSRYSIITICLIIPAIAKTEKQLPDIHLSGSKIKFSYCSLDKAIALLRKQSAVGTLELRVIRAK